MHMVMVMVMVIRGFWATDNMPISMPQELSVVKTGVVNFCELTRMRVPHPYRDSDRAGA
jgi:hypothetical protein